MRNGSFLWEKRPGSGVDPPPMCVHGMFVCLFLAQQPTVGQDLLIHEVSRSHTTTHHRR